MSKEAPFRQAVHLIVDRVMDSLIHSVISQTESLSHLYPTTMSTKEPISTQHTQTSHEVIPTELQQKKAAHALNRVGWRTP